MKNNGLLSSDQLEAIFLNLEELIHVNTQFTDRLQTAVDLALKHGDEVRSVRMFVFSDRLQTVVDLALKHGDEVRSLESL